MEWVLTLKNAIDYIEKHLLDDITLEKVADSVHVSSFYFQKGFSYLTGYTLGEYIRNRRLYLASLDLTATDEKIIDIAFKYGYETPESFTKAFSRFHGFTPKNVKRNTDKIRIFLPLQISLKIQGGTEMNYQIKEMNSFRIIGVEKEFDYDNAYQEIPLFWKEFNQKYCDKLLHIQKSETLIEKAIMDNRIGEFGICIDDIHDNQKFHYLIAGTYQGGDIPEGMRVLQIPAKKWVKFFCVGPLPGALQAVNTKIYQEWLPNHPEFDFVDGYNIEYYTFDDSTSLSYQSEIWLPVKEK